MNKNCSKNGGKIVGKIMKKIRKNSGKITQPIFSKDKLKRNSILLADFIVQQITDKFFLKLKKVHPHFPSFNLKIDKISLL